MSLMDAPAYDPTVDNRRRNVLFGISGALASVAALARARISSIGSRVSNSVGGKSGAARKDPN